MQGDELKVKVNKLTSTKTQLPYSYFSLPYCRPKKIVDSAENLGEVLRGDRIENSPFVVSFDTVKHLSTLRDYLISYLLLTSVKHLQFKMREPRVCNIACHVNLDAKTAKEFKEKINDEYRVNMYYFSTT